MDIKPSSEILGYLTERYLRFKEEEPAAPARHSDFDCGRMHQIVCTIADMTGRRVAEVRTTLDKLFEKQQEPSVFPVKPVSGHQVHLANRISDAQVRTRCGRIFAGIGPEPAGTPVSCKRCR